MILALAMDIFGLNSLFIKTQKKNKDFVYFLNQNLFTISGTKQHLGPVQLGTGNDQGGGGKANNNQRIKECA